MQIIIKSILIVIAILSFNSIVFSQNDRWIYVGTANHQKVSIYYDSRGINKYYEKLNDETSIEVMEVWIKYVYYKPVSDYYNQFLKVQPFSFKEYWELVKFIKETKTIITGQDYQFVNEKGERFTFDSPPVWINPITNRIYPFTIYEKIFEYIK